MDSRPDGVWQAHCLTGPYRDVGVGLFGLPRSVVDSGWYLLLFDTGEQAGIYLFTRTGDEVVLHEWTTTDLSDLPATVLRAAARSDSTSDAEAMLRARCSFVSSAPSIAPISARGAFGLPFDSLRGTWARALVLAR